MEGSLTNIACCWLAAFEVSEVSAVLQLLSLVRQAHVCMTRYHTPTYVTDQITAP